MENKFNNRDFEQFVKQNADEYRMFPSEKVWSGVNNAYTPAANGLDSDWLFCYY